MTHLPLNWTGGIALLGLALSTSGTVHANSSCDLVSRAEASRLLGVKAGKKQAQHAQGDRPGCLINAARGRGDTLTLAVTTLTHATAPREHMDEERGDEVPSMHGEAWYEVSVPDPQHPENRRLVIHRDRTSLILDLHSRHQADAKRAFESVWYQIAERLPFDER